MKLLIKPGKTRNIISTIAIGKTYYEKWEKNAFPTWEKYCNHHDLGLVVFDKDMVLEESLFWKKRQWQKLLIGCELKKYKLDVNNVCYLDTDILINYKAPNVFDHYKEGTIGLVSQKHNLPYPLDLVLRSIAYHRHFCYDKKYPLDSALFMSLKQIYEYHGMPVQKDYACTGFYIFNAKEHSQLMKEWFYKYDSQVESITGGGEEAHVNFELQTWGNITWLDYRFQALWMYEMAWKYPFLYDYGRYNNELIKECVEASLFTNYFLHFAGPWYESDMWKVGNVLESVKSQETFEGFSAYLKTEVTGKPKGQIKPKTLPR